MFKTSLDAEAAFYEAFSNADIELMMRVWAMSFDIACIHPSGPRLEGVKEIRESWQAILGNGVPRSFDLRGRVVVGSDDFRIHTLEENISVPGSNFVAPPVLATNVYQQIDRSWYIVLHHGSVSPQALEDAEPVEDNTSNVVRLH